MAIRISPVFRPHFPGLGSRSPHSLAPAAHRQEGSYDHHAVCVARPDHDKILQVLGGQLVGVLLRWHSGPAIVFGLCQELYERERDQHHIKQFPQRRALLRWLV